MIGVRFAAQKLGFTLKYVYDLLYAGHLRGRKIGRRWHIDAESIEERLRNRKAGN